MKEKNCRVLVIAELFVTLHIRHERKILSEIGQSRMILTTEL